VKAKAHLVRVLLIALCGALAGCRPPSPGGGRLLVRGAPTLAPAFGALAKEYARQAPGMEAQCDLTCPPRVLLRQLSGTVDFDVVAAVGADTVKAYEQRGLVQPGTARQFGSSRLVVVTSAKPPVPIQRVEDLKNPALKPIALADPSLLDLGSSAQRALEHLGLWDAVQPRLSLQQTGCATVKTIALGGAAAGIICDFCLYEGPGSQGRRRDLRVAATFPEQAAPPIALLAAEMTGSKQSPAAQQFINFLLTPAAQKIIAEYGITPVGAASAATSP
jgi:molybdate transport system substrate-binding protein